MRHGRRVLSLHGVLERRSSLCVAGSKCDDTMDALGPTIDRPSACPYRMGEALESSLLLYTDSGPHSILSYGGRNENDTKMVRLATRARSADHDRLHHCTFQLPGPGRSGSRRLCRTMC